jgi:hypothetical protein
MITYQPMTNEEYNDLKAAAKELNFPLSFRRVSSPKHVAGMVDIKPRKRNGNFNLSQDEVKQLVWLLRRKGLDTLHYALDADKTWNYINGMRYVGKIERS